MAGPKERLVDSVGLELTIIALESPNFLSILVEVVPPSQANQEPSSHIFDCPEIKRTEQDDDDEGVNIREEISEDEVAE